MLADDSPQALRLGENILTAQGFEVVSVTDGATALRRLTDVKPDLVITDVYLPTRNGFEIARFLRSQEKYRQLPVIFAAAPADEFNEQDATNAGANAVQGLLAKRTATRSASEEGTPDSWFDRHSIRAAVTLALDSSMPMLIEELTERVLLALAHERRSS